MLVALGKQCGDEDHVNRPKNLEGHEDYSRNSLGLAPHAKPEKIRKRVGDAIWKSYFKFTIVRNPWDCFVSRFERRRAREKEDAIHGFDHFVREALNVNSSYYFAADGSLIPDHGIRFENLESDYAAVCHRLRIPYERLPILKTCFRPRDESRKVLKHYTEYYTDETRDIVAVKYKQEIEFFHYKFGE
jgi:hypothetical protein